MGVAVKVTLVPAQMLICVATIETDGVTVELTVIATALLVAESGDAQAEFEVITHVTLAALVNVVDE